MGWNWMRSDARAVGARELDGTDIDSEAGISGAGLEWWVGAGM